jgi:hypothetical protein
MKGIGTLVTYIATPKAKVKPINKPTINPGMKRPCWALREWRAMLGL